MAWKSRPLLKGGSVAISALPRAAHPRAPGGLPGMGCAYSRFPPSSPSFPRRREPGVPAPQPPAAPRAAHPRAPGRLLQMGVCASRFPPAQERREREAGRMDGSREVDRAGVHLAQEVEFVTMRDAKLRRRVPAQSFLVWNGFRAGLGRTAPMTGTVAGGAEAASGGSCQAQAAPIPRLPSSCAPPRGPCGRCSWCRGLRGKSALCSLDRGRGWGCGGWGCAWSSPASR